MKKIYNRYKHSIPLIIYMAVYGAWFAYLEKAVTHPQTIIHVKLDDYIPFCEVFVIPYFLWFAYVSVVVLYCFFKNKQSMLLSFYRNDCFSCYFHPVAQRTASSSFRYAER